MVCVIAFIIVSFYLLIMVSAIEKHIEQFGGLNPCASLALFVSSLSLLLFLVPSKLEVERKINILIKI